MKFDDREYCLRLENDADDTDCLALYEGSMALGAPVAACSYLDAVHTPSLTTFADHVPSAALEWLREEAHRRLPSPDEPVPDLDSHRRPLWYYVGGTVVLLVDAAYLWRREAVHGGIWTALLAVAAGLLLLGGYRQYRDERQTTLRDRSA